MSNVPADLRYTAEHEYVKPTADPAVVTVGITDFAQGELGDTAIVEGQRVRVVDRERGIEIDNGGNILAVARVQRRAAHQGGSCSESFSAAS